MLKPIALAAALAAVATTASAGEILVVRDKQAIRFTGPFSAEPVTGLRGGTIRSCACVPVVDVCDCTTYVTRPPIEFETSVHRSGIGADSTIRANSDSDDSRVRYMYVPR